MGRLYRPHIPLSVRCEVAERRLMRKEFFSPINSFGVSELRVHVFHDLPSKRGAMRLAMLLSKLAKMLGCEVKDLRLDHDPPLGARPKHRRGLGKKTHYIPDANDPAHLFYRPHGPEHEGSHLIKTNVRGDHGQHPDRVLIKKQRRLERGPKPKRGPKIQSRGFRTSPNVKTTTQWGKRSFNRRKP